MVAHHTLEGLGGIWGGKSDFRAGHCHPRATPWLKGSKFSGWEEWTDAQVKDEVRGHWPGWSEIRNWV